MVDSKDQKKEEKEDTSEQFESPRQGERRNCGTRTNDADGGCQKERTSNIPSAENGEVGTGAKLKATSDREFPEGAKCHCKQEKGSIQNATAISKREQQEEPQRVVAKKKNSSEMHLERRGEFGDTGNDDLVTCSSQRLQADETKKIPDSTAALPGAVAVAGISSELSVSTDPSEDDLESPSPLDFEHIEENDEDLVVAVEVDDETIHEVSTDIDDGFLPSAVAFDPFAKPSVSRSKHWCLFSTFAMTVILIEVALAVIFFTVYGRIGSGTNAAANRRSLGIREQVEKTLNDSVKSAGLPYEQALHWLTHSDPLELLPGDPRLIQRFILAYFYYATSENHPWFSCSPPVGEEDATCIFSPLWDQSFAPFPAIRWLSDHDECTWAGVRCDVFQQVSELEIVGTNLTGTFPDGIKHLPHLQLLELGNGMVKGNIPVGLSKLKHLTRLDMKYNAISGFLPESLWTMENLHYLSIMSNQIRGSISSDISNLIDLKFLHIDDNMLTGSLPEEISKLHSLIAISGGNNLLTGTISSTVGDLTRLSSLALARNDLSGTLPTELGKLTNHLTYLYLGENRRLTGEIPPEVYLPNILFLKLHGCNFTGTINHRLSKMKQLTFFEVHNNNLYGQLPSNLGFFPFLDSVTLHGNDFTGTVPQSFCQARQLMLLADGGGISANCRIPDDGGEPQIYCDSSCCTRCCDSHGERCIDMN